MKHAALASLALALAQPLAAEPPPPANSCIACHGNDQLWDEQARRPVTLFAADVHAKAGLSCQDCHGGNPAPGLAEDGEAAMARGFKANPFRGAPDRKATPAFCARCHSDPAYMKRFNPGARVDQEREYWTSQHGEALKRGDGKVATCTDCHGAHGIKAIADPQSPVYPTQVAETCRTCHEDQERMKGRKGPDGRPLSLTQYAGWRQSVHAQALLAKGDLTAPTCNDCHGNHGATPPGLESIAAVCGQCHGREAQLFRASPKHAGFQDHAKLMAEASAQDCSACHDAPPGIAHAGPAKLSECVSCHGNHAVMRPTVALLAPMPATPCAFCHEGPEGLAQGVGEPLAKRRNYEATRDSLLAQARGEKLDSDALFDRLVDLALTLPVHTRTSADGSGLEQRPEFARLFSKFRIGKTYYTLDDPQTGKPVRTEVVRCSRCHVEEPQSIGFKTAGELLARMGELTALTARSERILLAARRGGVETRQALLDLDHAVDAQIELEVLVHGFSSAADSAFVKKHQEGVGHAQAALAAGQRALLELANRRKGLIVSSLVIALVLVGLALKIRELDRGGPG